MFCLADSVLKCKQVMDVLTELKYHDLHIE